MKTTWRRTCTLATIFPPPIFENVNTIWPTSTITLIDHWLYNPASSVDKPKNFLFNDRKSDKYVLEKKHATADTNNIIQSNWCFFHRNYIK